MDAEFEHFEAFQKNQLVLRLDDELAAGEELSVPTGLIASPTIFDNIVRFKISVSCVPHSTRFSSRSRLSIRLTVSGEDPTS